MRRSEAGRFPGGAFTPFEGFPSSAAVPHRCGRCPPAVRPPPPRVPVARSAWARGSLRPGEPGGIGRRVAAGSCSRTIRRTRVSAGVGSGDAGAGIASCTVVASPPRLRRRRGLPPCASGSVARPCRGVRSPGRLDPERRSRDAPSPWVVPPPRTLRPQAPRPIASSPRAPTALSRAPSGRLQGFAPPTSPFRRSPLPAIDDLILPWASFPSEALLAAAGVRGLPQVRSPRLPHGAEAEASTRGPAGSVRWSGSRPSRDAASLGFSTSKSRFESGVLAAPKIGLSRSVGRNQIGRAHV